MARVEKTIDVDVPVRTAYNQWTQFEEFPNFMEGVHEVRQLDDRNLHWRAKVGGKEEEWDAVIREQVPDKKIIWVNTSGAENAGVVTFDDLGPNQTRVHLEMSYDPEGFVEKVGDALGMVARRVQGDLQRFKDFVEARGAETGAFRGAIHNPDVPGGHTRGKPEADVRSESYGRTSASGPEPGGMGGEYPPDSGDPGGMGGEYPPDSGSQGIGGEYPPKRDTPGGMGGEYPERGTGTSGRNP